MYIPSSFWGNRAYFKSLTILSSQLGQKKAFLILLNPSLCFSCFPPLCSGVRIGLFTPGLAFEIVACKQIAALKGPATKLVGLVTEELQKILVEGLAKVLFGG